MPLNSKFFTESTGEKIVKTDQYLGLVKIWTKCNSLLFGAPCIAKVCFEFMDTNCNSVEISKIYTFVFIVDIAGNKEFKTCGKAAGAR